MIEFCIIGHFYLDIFKIMLNYYDLRIVYSVHVRKQVTKWRMNE